MNPAASILDLNLLVFAAKSAERVLPSRETISKASEHAATTAGGSEFEKEYGRDRFRNGKQKFDKNLRKKNQFSHFE